MKTFLSNGLVLLAFSALFSCSKQSTLQPGRSAVNAASSDDAIAAGKKWYGDYYAYREYPNSHPIPDQYFIANGYARIYSDTIPVHPWNYYSTAYTLYVPANKNIDGDNVTLEVGVKNPSTSSQYPAFHGRDVGLQLVGKSDSAFINNVIPDSIRPGAQFYAQMAIGSKVENNITALQYLFEDWGTLVMQTFNRGVVAYRNNEYLHGLPYGDQAPLGRLRKIRVSFKGSGYVDWVKLTNSATGELIMTEDFNTDGQSTIVWY